MKDIIALAEQAAATLKSRQQTIAVAESSTGGLISAGLLAIPGASAYFLGGAVVYTKRARRELMGLQDRDVAGVRSASEPYALLLAQTARTKFQTTWGISETGATGPTGNPYGDAAGHSCLAVCGGSGPGRERVMTLETGQSDRLDNMMAFTIAALTLLNEMLAGQDKS